LTQKEKDISAKQEMLEEHEASLAQKIKDCSIEQNALDDREAALKKATEGFPCQHESL
jgi:predicted DNA binding CopG/RHH family protein